MAKTEPVLTRIALVTGASSGIGKATASLFAKYGYDVIITGRRHKRLLDLQRKLEKKYVVKVLPLEFDIRKKVEVKKALQSLPDAWKTIDILVNNAGLAAGLHPIHEGKTAHWEQMIDTNIKGLLYITRIISPWMVKRRQGHIINVCSTAGHECYPNGNVYCATKHAVDALTKSMRLDLHKHNIRVGQVSPGHVEETEFALVRFDGDEQKAKIYEDFRPLRAKDVANVILFMATQPRHVNIQDVLMMGTQQASSVFINRDGRNNG